MTRALSGRKWPSIDVVRLYSRGDTAGWNSMLTEMRERQDVMGIKKTLYGIQSGVADAAKAGLVDDNLTSWFVRAQRSLENTAKAIFREKYPSPLDGGTVAKNSDQAALFQKELEAKRKRDQAFESFLEETRF